MRRVEFRIGSRIKLEIKGISPPGDQRGGCSPNLPSGLPKGVKRAAGDSHSWGERSRREARAGVEGVRVGPWLALRASLVFDRDRAGWVADGSDVRPLSRQARAVGAGAPPVDASRTRVTNSGCIPLRASGPEPTSSGLGSFGRKRPFLESRGLYGQDQKGLRARRKPRTCLPRAARRAMKQDQHGFPPARE